LRHSDQPEGSERGSAGGLHRDDLGKILALCKPLGKLLRRITGE